MAVQYSKQTQAAALRVKLRLQQQATSRLRYSNDPSLWIEEKAGGFVWSIPRQIAQSVVENRRTAIPACHELGKSWLFGRLAVWWIDTHPPGTAFVVTTAPSNRQVVAVLWKEMRRAWAATNRLGRFNQKEWWLNDELVALGYKPADYDPTAFQGIHAKYCLVLLDEGCHDDKTEVLTKNGWKFWVDVTLEDEFLSMNPKNNKAEYVKALQIIDKEYNGLMIQYESRNADFCVTPDHRMYYAPYSGRTRDLGNWRFGQAQTITNKDNQYLRHDITWEGEDELFFTLPEYIGTHKSFPEVDLWKDLWMMFLGWYCSEGSTTYKNGIPCVVQIAQKNQKNLDEIEEISRELGFNFSRYTNQIQIFDTQLAVHLSKSGRYCTEKWIPEEVRMASIEHINLFLDAYVKGDGYTHKGIDTIYTSSERMAADLQEIILKTGVNSNVRTRKLEGIQSDFGTHIGTSSKDGFVVIRSNLNTNLKFKPSNAKEIQYSGRVYCATLEKYGLLLTRRNGYPLWSGNCGIPENIYIAANSLAANDFSRIAVVGNPDDPDSHFAKVCSPGSGWNVIHVSAFDTPNFTGEEVPQDVKDVLVGPIYVDEMKRDVGEDSPVYISKVLGRFPENKVDGVILLSWIRRCQQGKSDDSIPITDGYSYNDLVPVELGVDVGAGGDETSIRARRGLLVDGRIWEGKTPEPEQAFHLVVQAVMETHATRCKIDYIGIGWGLVGMLRQTALRGCHYNEVTECEIDISFCTFVPVNVGQGSTDPTRFPRLRDQLWWEIGRNLSIDRGWDLTELDEITVNQLISPTWHRDLADRHKVESKKETMKRTQRPSPNRADALLLAFCEPPTNDIEEVVIAYEPEYIGPGTRI